MPATPSIESVRADLPPDSETKYGTYMSMNLGQLKAMLRELKLLADGEKQQLVVRLIRKLAGMPLTTADAELVEAAAVAASAAKAEKQKAAKVAAAAKAAEAKVAKEAAALAASKEAAAAAASQHVDAVGSSSPKLAPSSPKLQPGSPKLDPKGVSPKKRKVSTPIGDIIEDDPWPRRFLVVNEKKIGFLPKPDVGAEVSGYLRPQEVFQATQESIDSSGRRFLLLADFRGWVPECSRKEGSKKIVEEIMSEAKKARIAAAKEAEVAQRMPSDENLQVFVETYIHGVDIDKVTLTDLNKALEAKFGEVPVEKWRMVRGIATEVIQKRVASLG